MEGEGREASRTKREKLFGNIARLDEKRRKRREGEREERKRLYSHLLLQREEEEKGEDKESH